MDGQWSPTSEAEISTAIAERLINETHYFDGKRSIGSKDAARTELARDLASFAINGGTLLVGIDEDKQERTWSLAPQPLKGLPERVEQIATFLVEPPLYAVTTEIPSGQPGNGYLLVEVPPSAQAPHMVDGVYYGRGDKTRIRLSDADVVRHHVQRQAVESIAERLLDGEVDRDPVGDPSGRTCGRLYGVAQPLTAKRDLALSLVRGEGELRRLVQASEPHLPQNLLGVEPAPHKLQSHVSRAHGVALCSYEIGGPGRTLRRTMRTARPTRSRSSMSSCDRTAGFASSPGG